MESSLGWEREEGESLLPKSTASLLPSCLEQDLGSQSLVHIFALV